MQYLVSFHLDVEKRAGYFTLIVFLVSCDCWCSVALPHVGMGLSVVCDCCISCSCPLIVSNGLGSSRVTSDIT